MYNNSVGIGYQLTNNLFINETRVFFKITWVMSWMFNTNLPVLDIPGFSKIVRAECINVDITVMHDVEMLSYRTHIAVLILSY